jgi:Mrp family chromosome partitioning ATPase
VEPTQRENVSLLRAGKADSDPATLLRPVRLRKLFSEILRTSDLVIVDGPPVTIGPDATLLAQAIDTTLIVLSSRRTTRAAALATIKQLRRARRPLAGAILNEVRDRTPYYDYRPSRRGRSLPRALAGDETTR